VSARAGDFSLAALHAALDERRRARGLSWSQAAREIDRRQERSSRRGLSASTISAIGGRAVAEGDGVLQMLIWLDRTPESFVPDHPEPDGPLARLPHVPPNRILRFDTVRLHAALDSKRQERSMSWSEIGRVLELAPSTLTRLSAGGRTAFPAVMRMSGWLGMTAARFTRAADP